MRQKTTTKPVVKQSDLNPKEFVRLYGQPPEYSTMWNRLKELELIEEDLKGASDEEVAEEDELFERDLILGGEEDDEVFQL
jgi:pantothenate kinase-related protein Tda10